MVEGRVKTEEAEKLIKSALDLIDEKNYSTAQEHVDKAYKIFKEEHFTEGISICLSLISFSFLSISF